MSTTFPGFSGPAASTEAPLEMLAACHIRVQRQCATLQRLVAHLQAHGSNQEASVAATNIMRYFDTAAIQHHADEEADLFPALLESMAGSDPVCIREITEGLIADHRQLEALWRDLKQTLELVATGQPALLSSELVASFVRLYERHIQIEENELLPMAARLLSDGDITRIGRAMRERRGIPEQ
ncbi:hemerythrin domain-containing protein [Alcaligenaceae bacterium]|nr:hemerythrin domain-containing protein [Alcaligenaceae bacterium]